MACVVLCQMDNIIRCGVRDSLEFGVWSIECKHRPFQFFNNVKHLGKGDHYYLIINEIVCRGQLDSKLPSTSDLSPQNIGTVPPPQTIKFTNIA